MRERSREDEEDPRESRSLSRSDLRWRDEEWDDFCGLEWDCRGTEPE